PARRPGAEHPGATARRPALPGSPRGTWTGSTSDGELSHAGPAARHDEGFLTQHVGARRGPFGPVRCASMREAEIDVWSLPREVGPPDQWQDQGACYGLDQIGRAHV